jgi:hypothetical protein
VVLELNMPWKSSRPTIIEATADSGILASSAVRSPATAKPDFFLSPWIRLTTSPGPERTGRPLRLKIAESSGEEKWHSPGRRDNSPARGSIP